MSLSWEKSMPTLTTTTTSTAMRLCSTPPTSPQPRNRLVPPLNSKRTRLSTRSRLKRWTGSERTCYRLTWETPHLSSHGEILLKRPHSGIISFRGCWWMRSAGRTCHRLLLLLGFQCLHRVPRLGCFSSHNRSQLRRVLSLKKKEVKN